MPIVKSPPPVEEYTPAPYTGHGASAAGLALNPNDYPDFRLMYHPRRWQFFETERGNVWLPNLAALHLVPGLNCVDKDGGTSLAFAEREDMGWTVLRDAVSYVGQHNAQPLPSGKIPKIYLPLWMRPQVMAGTVRVVYDRAEHVKFLIGLVVSGKIPNVEAGVVELLRSRIQDEHDRDSGESTADGKAAGRAKKAAAILAAMDKASPPAALA